MENVEKILKTLAGWDDVITFVMAEVEHCDDMLYNENLSAANYIYWKSRKDALLEVRDVWSKSKK